jgi:hypothetical protein
MPMTQVSMRVASWRNSIPTLWLIRDKYKAGFPLKNGSSSTDTPDALRAIVLTFPVRAVMVRLLCHAVTGTGASSVPDLLARASSQEQQLTRFDSGIIQLHASLLHAS